MKNSFLTTKATAFNFSFQTFAYVFFSGTCNVVGFFLPISFFAQKLWSGIARTCYEFSLCTFDFDCQIIVKCKSDCIIFYSQKKLRKVCILCAQSMWNQNIFFIVELWKLFRLEITVFFSFKSTKLKFKILEAMMC